VGFDGQAWLRHNEGLAQAFAGVFMEGYDMLDKITPGTKIKVKIIKTPTNAAASKTLVRVLSKDRGIMKENDRLRRVRKTHLVQSQRGGRFWDINVVKQQPLKAVAGVEKTIVATTSALADLSSVSRFIEVAKA